MLLFPLITAVIGWEFGPMLHAEVETLKKFNNPTSRPINNYGAISPNDRAADDDLGLDGTEDNSE